MVELHWRACICMQLIWRFWPVVGEPAAVLTGPFSFQDCGIHGPDAILTTAQNVPEQWRKRRRPWQNRRWKKRENCGRVIGKLETPMVRNDHIVCQGCRRVLAAEREAPQERATAERHPAVRELREVLPGEKSWT